MKRIAAGLLILCLLLLFGCSPKTAPAPEEASYKIALGMGGMNHPVHRLVRNGFLEGAKNVGVNGYIVGLDEGTAKDLQEKWESAIQDENLQGMVLWASDDTHYAFMREMKAAHGTVFVVPHFQHEYIDTKDFIAANLYTEGRKLGEAAADKMIEALAEHGITTGSIGITRTGDVTDAICDGFRDRMAETAPQYTILPQVFCSVEVSQTVGKLLPLIDENSDLVGAFASYDGDTQAWLRATEQAGLDGLVLVGIDYSAYTLDAVEEDTVAALVTSDTYREGYEGAKILANILGGNFSQSEEEWRRVYDPVIITQTQNYEKYRTLADAVMNVIE